MSVDSAEQGRTKHMKTDTMVVAGGGQQATASSPPTESLNGGEEEPEQARKPVVEFQNDPCDDEEELCRICRTPGEEEHPLYYPCACKGSMKFTHEECLRQWLNYRNTQRGLDDKQCEICKHAFAFQYVYAENTLSRLPLLELILGIALKAARWMRFFICELLIANLIVVSVCLILLSVLLLVIPFTTAWLWRLIFVRSFSEAHKLIISRCTSGLLLMDWFYGISLLVKVVFRLDIGLLSKHVSDMVFERLQELRLQRVRAGRQVVVEVPDPRPGHVGFWVLKFVLKEIITPVLTRELIALCVRILLVFAQWMFPSLGHSLIVSSAWDRYAWLGCLAVVVLWYGGKRMKQWLSDLHDSIRDDRYSIGKRLQNLERTHEKSD